MRLRRIGFAIHAMTACGAVAGLIALQHIVDGDVRGGLLWLLACQVLDGIDGPVARSYGASEHAGRIDGRVLDLVVDYVTCVVVPVVLMLHVGMVEPRLSMVVAGMILLSSALWFARTDQETPDHWFRGFPAGWNVVIPALLLLHAPSAVVTAVVVCCAVLQLSDVTFPHVSRVRALRGATVSFAALTLACFAYLSATYPGGSDLARSLLLVGPAYLAIIVAWRTWAPSLVVFGMRIDAADSVALPQAAAERID